MTAQKDPEALVRSVIAACTDCDECRYLLAPECPVFETLYRLHDREADGGPPVAGAELQRMAALCNCCGFCVCPDIRADIVEARTRFVERDGMPLGVRLMTRIETLAAAAGRLPQAANAMLRIPALADLLKRAAGIHPDRRLPDLPRASFPEWARREGVDRMPAAGAAPKVAYFAGCTGRRLFPEVPISLVRVFRRAGISVFYPGQQCCGMPAFAEGDRGGALSWVRSAVETLSDLVDEGFSVVCSCPTCGYLFKTLIRERAYYSEAYQAAAGGDSRVIVVPDEGRTEPDGSPGLLRLSRAIYGKLLQDDGYFSSIDPMRRIRVAENTFDAGEFLLRHIRDGGGTFGPAEGPRRLAYFVPCHQREQKMGRPYLELLRTVPGLSLDVVDGPFDCCGMGGNMGFKEDFHDTSLAVGGRVAEKILGRDPEGIVTDCLSCRLQFAHLTDLPVFHPLEILARASR